MVSCAAGDNRCGGHCATHLAAYLLPNTEQWFTKWRKTFVALLIVFPVIGVLYGASTLASDVVERLYRGTDNEKQQVREIPARTIGR